MIKAVKEKINFRELQEGSLITLVDGGQPIIFEGIKRGTEGDEDSAKLIYLDPINGLCRREYYLRNGQIYNDREYDDEEIDHESDEGRKYLKLITGK